MHGKSYKTVFRKTYTYEQLCQNGDNHEIVFYKYTHNYIPVSETSRKRIWRLRRRPFALLASCLSGSQPTVAALQGSLLSTVSSASARRGCIWLPMVSRTTWERRISEILINAIDCIHVRKSSRLYKNNNDIIMR